MQVEDEKLPRDHDPGDAVPPGVAPRTPAPLSGEDRKVKQKLEREAEAARHQRNTEIRDK